MSAATSAEAVETWKSPAGVVVVLATVPGVATMDAGGVPVAKVTAEVDVPWRTSFCCTAENNMKE